MKNDYLINGEVVTVYVTRQDSSKYEVYLDLDVFIQIQSSSITVKQYYDRLYAIVVIDGKHHYLHRYVAQTISDKVCRPIDGNCLNTCKSNLISEDRYNKQEYEINGNEVKVFIISRGMVHELLLDIHIWEEYKNYSFGVKPHGDKWSTVITTGIYRQKHLHRVITNAPDDKQIDHIDNNPMNNKLSNLRFCTGAENSQNMSLNKNNVSGCPGVTWCNTYNKWIAQPYLAGKRYKLGRFDNKEEAIRIVREFRANNMPFSKEAMNNKYVRQAL